MREAWHRAKQRNAPFIPTADNNDMAISTMFITLQNSDDEMHILRKYKKKLASAIP